MESKESVDLDLHKYWLILKRRWLPATGVFASVIGLAIPIAFLQKPSYQAQGKLLFKIDKTSSLTGVGGKLGDLNPLVSQSNPLKTETEVISSIPLLQKTIDALNLKDEKGKPLNPEAIRKGRLKLKNLTGTDVLEISYKSSDSQEAAAVINKLMSLYIENNKLTNRAEAAAAREFIAQKLPETEATVRQAEVDLRQFKERNRVVVLEDEARSAVEAIGSLDKQIRQVQAELEDANARSAAFSKKIGLDSQDALSVSALSQSPGVQQVLTQYQQVEAELAVQRTRFSDDNPAILNLKDKEAALKAVLQERISQTLGAQQPVPSRYLQSGNTQQLLTQDFVKSEIERLGMVKRLAALSKARTAYQERVTILPKLEQNQRELERKLKAAQSTYETLLQKLQEIRVAENQNIGNTRIIEPAGVPDKPSLLKQLVIVGIGGALGIIFGLGTIIILEIKDTSIKTLKEIRELFGYTLLGTIPSFKKKVPRAKNPEWTVPELPVRDNPHSPLTEAFRMLQANLKFLSSDKALKVIVVTSSVAKEGKSTVSANLAAAMAQLGRRVLLVDADLRHPLQHHIWELTNAAGLSDVLVGQAEFKAAATQPMDNLDVLSAGVIPPNPLALLDSKRMASLIEHFAKTYDFVIIDAPPLVVAADALTLGKMTDGLLLVARPAVVDCHSAAAAKELLERSGQNILGLVVNGVIVENESDSYYYYSQGYFAEEDSTSRQQATSKR